MQWRESTFLWLLPLVGVLAAFVVAALRRRARALQSFAEEPLLERLAVGADPRRRAWTLAIRVVVLALLAVALAGPKWGFHWEPVKREGIDLIIAMDTSRSMLATDVKPNRLERAKLAVLDLLAQLRGDRIGLVAFAGTAFLESPLTLDYAAFERSLRSLRVGIIPRGGTALSRAIETSLQAFEAREGKYEALVLITDGEDHEGDAKAAAEKAAERGVKIYTVGIGTADGELVPLQGGAAGYVKDRKGQVVKSRLDEATLQEIAVASGGAYVRGIGPRLGLDEVFDEHIAKMERREVDSSLERRYEERFQWPLAAALFLLAVESLMRLRRGERRARRSWARPWRRIAGESGHAALPLLMLVAAMPSLLGWLGGGGPLREGNRLYDEGKYSDAVQKFGESLVDSPASPLLQYNLAAALYKDGKYAEAIAALEKVAAEGGKKWTAPANYNLGNAHFRSGEAVEESDPQSALQSYEQALLAYRRAMAADPADPDPKFNHELVEQRRDELRKRLEEEKEKQEQEQQDQQEQQDDQQQEEQQDDQQQEQQQQDQQQEEQQQQDEQQQEQQDQQQQQGEQDQEQQDQQQQDEQQAQEQEQDQQQQEEQAGEQQPEEQQQPAAQEENQQQEPEGQGGSAVAGDEAPESPEEQAAQAILDTARSEELGPEDIDRPVTVRGLGEPAEDW